MGWIALFAKGGRDARAFGGAVERAGTAIADRPARGA
jgi:hypothetical protein